MFNNIRKSEFNDLDNIANCHIKAFPGSLSSKMGRKFLSKMLEWYLVSEKGFLFHVENDGKILGFCGGIIVDGSLSTGSASAMTQHSFKMAIWAFISRPYLLLHKDLLSKYLFVLRNIYYRIRKPKLSKIKKKEQSSEPHTGLVVIGVDPINQGKGIGSILLKEFETITRKEGISKMKLSVRNKNTQAIGTYNRNGWEVLSKSKESFQMVKHLD